MLTDQKLRDILKHVWHPKIDLTDSRDMKKLDQLVLQIHALLDAREGSAETLAEFLKTTSIQRYNAEVSDVKSVHTAKLISDWYFPIDAKWTDYGRVSIQRSVSRFVDQDCIVYQTDTLKMYIPLDYIAQNEIEIYFDKIDLPDHEKQQLIDAIEDLLKPKKTIFYDEHISKRMNI